MKADSREKRRNEILDAAVKVLSERGYRDTTMLLVAREASASKETLYAWFGDKQGLFEAVIRRNAKNVQQVLSSCLETQPSPHLVLMEFGRALLALLLSESAVAINRAAISEARSDPRLAKLLSKAGREATLPAFVRYIELGTADGKLKAADPAAAAEDFLGLLLGDLPTRRHLGLVSAPTRKQIETRAARAAEKFLQLYVAST